MKFTKFAGIFAILLAFALSVIAQTTNPTPPPKIEDDGDIIKVESRLVVVPVSVLDSIGQPVLGLKAQDFRILEENKPQEIAQVSDAEKVPLEISLLFDVSASTDAMFQFEQETAAKFLQEVMRPEDRATIFTVGETARLIQARDTADKSAIAIKSILPTKQQTAFYDSVSFAATYLQKNAPQGRRKVIVVISDGDDTNSAGVIKAIFDAERKIVQEDISKNELRNLRVKARDAAKLKEQNKVVQSLQDADTVFYSINPGGNSYQLNQGSLFGQSNLQKFADETGGTAFLPKLLPTDLKDQSQNSQNFKKNAEILVTIFRQLANELRAQYLVQYYSESDFPNNKYVKLNVGLTNANKFRVRARQGYFAKN
ncbi:MAG: VWA domain-containing protein [Acidobacteria bacterium]|nr:VWA domain-containing protein [Acidobacteriota bacterium]